MSHFDASANQQREALVRRLAENRAAFVISLQEAAAARRATGSAGVATELLHHSTTESKAHRSIFSPLLYWLQLGYEGLQQLRRTFGRGDDKS
jgi:hypothetical protein